MRSQILLFIQKYSRREFLPWYIFDIPQYLYLLYLSIKAKSFTFFSNVNPGMILGWAVGYSKYKDLEIFPDNLKPKTIFVSKGEDINSLLQRLKQSNIEYPCIAKPDMWRIWRDVKKIQNENELISYYQYIQEPIIIQEFIDYSFEFWVFYYRLPSENKWHITWIVEKQFMFLEWDGVNTFEQLVYYHPRSKYYYNQMRSEYEIQRKSIPVRGEKIQLNYIGNHCRWSVFYDVSNLINPELEKIFDNISKEIDWFYFGRYDIKVKSIEDLKQGNMKIIELNGIGSLPTHIYDPKHTIWNAYSTIFKHRDIAYRISRINYQKGILYTPLKEALKIIKMYGI